MHEPVLGDNYTFTINQGILIIIMITTPVIIIIITHDNYRTLQNFIKVVNSQEDYNKGGRINAIPIIIYHNIVNDSAPYQKIKPAITID
jgi:hypothetical protein